MRRDDELRVLARRARACARISASWPFSDSAASGSSRMYSPRGPKRDRECEERLAVRLLVQRPLEDVARIADALVDRRREVEEALGAEEETELSGAISPRSSSRRRAGGVDARVAKLNCLRPPPSGLSRRDRHRFDQRRLAAAVLADEERDLRIELDAVAGAKAGHFVRVVPFDLVEAPRPDLDGVDERCRRGRGAHTLIMPRYPHGMLGSIISVIVTAFFTGALARFAVPGPDPMPAWLTILIGLIGTLIGAGIVLAVVGKDPAWVGIAGFIVSIAS